MRIANPDVRLLAGISQALETEYTSEDTGWEGSPFAWIKKRPSRQIGKIGELLVAGWLAARGFNVSRSGDSDADRVIEDKRIEIKFSTLWANGNYKFQQLRDQRYEIAFCLGISPFDAHCWVIPKADIIRLWKVEHIIASPHGGQDGADTAWIDVRPDNPPVWLRAYGGSLTDGLQLFSSLTGFVVETLHSALDEHDI